MKVGRDKLTEDVEGVAAMRNLLGPDIPLMVDASIRTVRRILVGRTGDP